MSLALALTFYGGVVATFGPPVLRRLTHRGIAPRLGVIAWVVAIIGALSGWGVAAAVLTVEFATYWGHPKDALRACASFLWAPADAHGAAAGHAATFAVAALVATGTVALIARAVGVVMDMRRRTSVHARAVRLVGRPVPGIGAVVLDSPERQVYCVPGRPDTIVVTTAALDALDDDQLAAVLAHERAHLSGRHAALTAVLRAVASTLPGLRLFTGGAAEIARLLEMCADDKAADEHGSLPLLGGLLAIVGIAEPAPPGALAAAGTAVLARAERLADPVGAVRRATTRTALLGVIAMTVTGSALAATTVACVGTLLN
ncbi:M56 family metallopeptidase [Nocardia beijingensis]|uniref:M56 family metallopeptidase n=1 Tax=Nocardia beijingensis TaxID=95162 RepID=UPI001895571B|nr:M56 family metallopeptidase [Nocardia beijingensis]MBF6076482.1 M56 family metallopeptidase [Nocardia beijingensis]